MLEKQQNSGLLQEWTQPITQISAKILLIRVLSNQAVFLTLQGCYKNFER